MRTNMLNALNMWFNLLVAFATDAGRHSGDIHKAYASTHNRVQSAQWFVIMGVMFSTLKVFIILI